MDRPPESPEEVKTRQDYRAIFAEHEVGRRVLKHMMDRYRFFVPTHAPGDPCETAYREGQRRVVLDILGHCHDDRTVEILLELQREAQEQYNARLREQQSARVYE